MKTKTFSISYNESDKKFEVKRFSSNDYPKLKIQFPVSAPKESVDKVKADLKTKKAGRIYTGWGSGASAGVQLTVSSKNKSEFDNTLKVIDSLNLIWEGTAEQVKAGKPFVRFDSASILQQLKMDRESGKSSYYRGFFKK